MSRLTIRAEEDGVKTIWYGEREVFLEGEIGYAEADKLAHYEDLEEQLEKLYGGKMSLDEVVENLNRIVQNGEEKLDYARILTNAEAEKWDKWKDLKEHGRLMELPCAEGDTVYLISSQYSECSKYQERFNDCSCQGCEDECDSYKDYFIHVNENISAEWIVRAMRLNRFGENVFLTQEAAEAKLEEWRVRNE